MPGLIKREDIDEVRARTRIEEIVGQYVSLRTAGVDSQVGLCPFHDEKTPSFHVRPHVGRWHCFGCGEGGDVISFVEQIEHISFVEAVELLARKAGIELHYEDNGRAQRRDQNGTTRQRLIDAHRVAVDFYVAQLHTPAGEKARQLLTERGFDDDALARFRIGYSPDSWDGLLRQLRGHGFSEKEIAASGLTAQGSRGLYDRFRGRLMWPITSITGEPIGFGARKLSDEDNGPKYLNTPETPIYHKAQVLYGLDMAKRAIARERRIVVVEGYTDVMAAQLAGIECAVATCGTAFGSEHVKIVRRLIGDGADPAAGVMLSSGRAYGGEVIFTFDGDAAGQKAALRAFQEDQAFAAQTFVAVAAEGMDPCEVRMAYGDEGVRAIIQSRRPLFEFAIQSVLKGVPLDTAEGRTAGLRASAPMVASIRDRVLRGEYTRQLAGWLGMDEATVRQAVQHAGRQVASEPRRAESSTPKPEAASGPPLAPRASLRDPVERIEREALEVYLQLPGYAASAQMDELPSQTFTVPTHRRVHEAIRAVGGTACYTQRFKELQGNGVDPLQADREASSWFVEQVAAQADPVIARAVSQLAVEELPENRPERLERYVWSIAVSLIRQGITRQIADLRSELQRTSADDPRHSELFARLIELEGQRRACDEQME
ncbi:MAG: DNA primase [Actinomycetaceae bacterium]|jgi:DNA primase|nr:DNA primase [Actinomycetaceae bacterium]